MVKNALDSCTRINSAVKSPEKSRRNGRMIAESDAREGRKIKDTNHVGDVNWKAARVGG